MRRRVNSMVPAVLFGFIVTIMASVDNPAQADSACIEQPSQPAAQGARWQFRYDRAKGRKCWILADAPTNAHDVAVSQGQPSAVSEPSLSSRLASLFGSLKGSSANVAPQGSASQGNLTNSPRKTQGSSASSIKIENSVRADQKDVVQGHAGKRALSALTQPERNALFEEFLRWHEGQQNNRVNP